MSPSLNNGSTIGTAAAVPHTPARAITAAPTTPDSHATNLSMLLPIPKNLAQGLTRLQHLLSIATGINPLVLMISKDEEFILFMDLCAQHQWKSFMMTSHRWVMATQIYNERLIKQNMARGVPTIEKKLRALMDKLGDIEGKIIEWILTGNYKCELPPRLGPCDTLNFHSNSQERQ
jgi:hypothetical protein